ncbi:hypothetical protein [Pseudomonas bohemica]|uniref:hypothetical protein n=1 Tax=Pseudomonas bohemica TaxID=2044872 RepID=UPI0018FE3D0F|nr:hypothetical protein [Pseudomonas bohemica]
MALIFSNQFDPDDIHLTNTDLLELLLDELSMPDGQSKLSPYSPVLVNVLRQYLAACLSRESSDIDIQPFQA